MQISTVSFSKRGLFNPELFCTVQCSGVVLVWALRNAAGLLQKKETPLVSLTPFAKSLPIHLAEQSRPIAKMPVLLSFAYG